MFCPSELTTYMSKEAYISNPCELTFLCLKVCIIISAHFVLVNLNMFIIWKDNMLGAHN